MAVPGERLRLRLDYRADLFERDGIEALGERLVRLLEAAVAAPDRPIGSLDILGPSERDTILRGWNDTAHALAPATLPELFAAQVARTPDAVAVVFEEQSLTYAQLDARANQLAHHLRGLGVGPETVVGLCVERSLEMVVGLLGILKAGGAYLPLDPELSGRAPRLHARGCRRPRCWSPIRRCSIGCPPTAPACSASMPTGPQSPAHPATAPAHRASTPTTPPTSSTPQAPPEHQKASWSPIRTSCDCSARPRHCSTLARMMSATAVPFLCI